MDSIAPENPLAEAEAESAEAYIRLQCLQAAVEVALATDGQWATADGIKEMHQEFMGLVWPNRKEGTDADTDAGEAFGR